MSDADHRRTLTLGLARIGRPGIVPDLPGAEEPHVLLCEPGDEEPAMAWRPLAQRTVSLAEALAVPGDSAAHTVLELADVPPGASVYAFVRVDLADQGDAPGGISLELSLPEGTAGDGGGGAFTLASPAYSASAYVFDRTASGGTVRLAVNAGTIASGVNVVRALLVAVADS